MKVGVFSTFMSPLATPQMIRDFGRRAEDIGLESIWMGEHVALFDKNTFGYPGSADGRIPVPPGGGMLDVEESVYLGGPVVRRAEQLVVSGTTKDSSTEIAWVFEQIVA